MSINRTQTIFLDSSNRSAGTIDNAVFQVGSDLIKTQKGEHMRLKLSDFCTRNGYRDIVTGANDQFVLHPANPGKPIVSNNYSEGFTITWGAVNPVIKYITIAGVGYLTNNQIATELQTALNTELSSANFTVKYQNWNNPSSATGKTFGIVDNSSGNTSIFSMQFSGNDAIRTLLGFQHYNYPVSPATATNAYYAETADLPDVSFPSVYVTLPQGFVDLDSIQTLLQQTYPFCGGTVPGDSTITTAAWTITTNAVTNQITFMLPSSFPSSMTLNFTDLYLPKGLTTNTLLGFAGSNYGPAAPGGNFTSDQEVKLTRVSNLVIHTDVPPKRSEQALDNFATAMNTLNPIAFMKCSNQLARIPVNVEQGALIGWRSLQDDFLFETAAERLQSIRIWLTDELNQPISMTPDCTFNAVLKIDYIV